MLYTELFKDLERVRWNMETDVPWDSFDASKLSDEQAQTIKLNAITEWSALPATEMFLRDNRGDSDFSAFMSVWFYEEQKHSLVLMEYLRRFRPELVPTEAELDNVRFEFDPAPALETLMMHFCGEVRLNHWYRRASEWHSEPLIKHIYGLIAKDEARHAGAYLKYLKQAIARAAVDKVNEVKAGFAKIGFLMAASGRSGKPMHPTNLHVNQALFPKQAARPGMAGALARRTDQVRQGMGRQGRQDDPAQSVKPVRQEPGIVERPQQVPQDTAGGAAGGLNHSHRLRPGVAGWVVAFAQNDDGVRHGRLNGEKSSFGQSSVEPKTIGAFSEKPLTARGAN